MLVNLKKAPYNPVQQADTGEKSRLVACAPRGARAGRKPETPAMPSSTSLHDPRAARAQHAQLRIAPDARRDAGISR
jgi:hypothetical protein